MPCRLAPARSVALVASTRQREATSVTAARASSRWTPPRSVSESTSSSTRSAVSETAPIPASTSCSSRSREASLPGSSMWPRAPALAPPLALRLGAGDRPFDRGNRRELRRRLGSGRLLGGDEDRLLLRLGHRLPVEVAAPRPLGVAFHQAREQRRCDEGRADGAHDDSDHDREGEVLERRAAEEEQ